MKFERCLTGTPAEMRAAQVAVDKALGYPRRGVQVGGGVHVPMPDTWDGKGACPPGWTATASEPVFDVNGGAYLAITGLEGALVDPANVAKLAPADVQAISKLPQSQLYDLASIVATATDAADAALAAVKNSPADFIGAGIGAAAVIAEIISQFL